MAEKQFDFIQEQDKIFMIEFTKALKKWGIPMAVRAQVVAARENMLIFRKKNVKSKNVVTCIYPRGFYRP